MDGDRARFLYRRPREGKLKTALILIIAVALAVIANLHSHRGPTEPSCDGVRLSTLLRRAANGDNQAEVAVRAIGTNGLPFLIRRIAVVEPGTRRRLYEGLDNIGLDRIDIDSPLKEHILAYAGFRALGPAAAPAIPSLVRLMQTTNTSSTAALALGAIGTAGVRELCAQITNGNAEIRFDVVVALRETKGDIPLVTTCLVQCLDDPDYVVRWAAAESLGRVNRDPELTVPALVKAVSDPSRIVRKSALESLGRFGHTAQNALAVVSAASNDPDPLVRAAAIAAADQIERGAAH